MIVEILMIVVEEKAEVLLTTLPCDVQLQLQKQIIFFFSGFKLSSFCYDKDSCRLSALEATKSYQEITTLLRSECYSSFTKPTMAAVHLACAGLSHLH